MLVWPSLIQVTEAWGAVSVTRQSTGRKVCWSEYWREATAGSRMTVGRSAIERGDLRLGESGAEDYSHHTTLHSERRCGHWWQQSPHLLSAPHS